MRRWWLPGIASIACAAPAAGASYDVITLNFNYQPADLTIRVGDTVRFQAGLFHPLRFDDGSPGCDVDCAIRFDAPGTHPYYCLQHGSVAGFGMSGVIRVVAPPFAIDEGIAGAWFEPATTGQGLLIDIAPTARAIFVGWFTFQPSASVPKLGAAEHRWLTAQGSYTGDTATIPIFSTSGGAFDRPGGTATHEVGQMTLRFASCIAGTLRYELPADGLSGEIPIQRLLPSSPSRCETVAPEAP